MSGFDAETGLRIGAQSAAAGARQPVNPYARALTAIWSASGFLAVICLLIWSAHIANDGSAPVDATTTGPMVAGLAFAAIAVVGVIAHVAVKAATWRPHTDDH